MAKTGQGADVCAPEDTPEKTPRKKNGPDADGVSKMVRYSARVSKRICERLAKGESWTSISQREGMPSYPVFYVWQRTRPEFAQAVAIARQIGAEFKADKALAVAAQATSATVQADRLHVGTLMKHAALTAPRQWGARAEAADGGADDGKLVLEIRVRRFERVVGPDGQAFVRELKTEGAARKRRRRSAGNCTPGEPEDGQ
jgi:hypothetical protein